MSRHLSTNHYPKIRLNQLPQNQLLLNNLLVSSVQQPPFASHLLRPPAMSLFTATTTQPPFCQQFNPSPQQSHFPLLPPFTSSIQTNIPLLQFSDLAITFIRRPSPTSTTNPAYFPLFHSPPTPHAVHRSSTNNSTIPSILTHHSTVATQQSLFLLQLTAPPHSVHSSPLLLHSPPKSPSHISRSSNSSSILFFILQSLTFIPKFHPFLSISTKPSCTSDTQQSSPLFLHPPTTAQPPFLLYSSPHTAPPFIQPN